MLALCLILELVGGIVALIFRTQVQTFVLFFFVSCIMLYVFLPCHFQVTDCGISLSARSENLLGFLTL